MSDLEFYQQRVHDRNGVHTIGDFVGAVLAIKDAADAQRFYSGCVHWHSIYGQDDKLTPDAVAKANIGWCFGEGMPSDQREMWIRVCGASHPVFGQSIPSAEDAFRMGIAAGKRGRQ